MRISRPLRNDQFCGNLAIGETSGDQHSDVRLPTRQLLGAGRSQVIMQWKVFSLSRRDSEPRASRSTRSSVSGSKGGGRSSTAGPKKSQDQPQQRRLQSLSSSIAMNGRLPNGSLHSPDLFLPSLRADLLKSTFPHRSVQSSPPHGSHLPGLSASFVFAEAAPESLLHPSGNARRRYHAAGRGGRQ